MVDTRYMIEIISEVGTESADIMDEVFFKFKNPLRGIYTTSNSLAICNYCREYEHELYSIMMTSLSKISAVPALYMVDRENPNVILRQISKRGKKGLRITLSPGDQDSLNKLNTPETTHHMVEYVMHEDSKNFHPTEKHQNSPIFFQRVTSSDTAELYIEALIVDAAMCHYMGVSDAALNHGMRQAISQEKVQFIREIVNGTINIEMSNKTRRLVEYVGKQLATDTPYISFFSIFSIAPKDCYPDDLAGYNLDSFKDYCKLWESFQLWYFHKHGKYFSRLSSIEHAFQCVFERNKFKGQLSVAAVIKAVEVTMEREEEIDLENCPIGWNNMYAFAILKHVPNSSEKFERLTNIYKGKIHQNTWKIISRQDYKIFKGLEELVCFVPFVME